MTKPVQIPRYSVQRDENGSYLRLDQEGSLVGHRDHLADKEATLLQVREMLEAKAKALRERWVMASESYYAKDDNGASSHDEKVALMHELADELLSLAATLGNQGK